MWKLTLDKSTETEYLNKILPRLVENIQKWQGKDGKGRTRPLKYTGIRSKLLPDWNESVPSKTDRLVKLLTAKPEEAYNLNKTLMKSIVKGYNENDLEKKKLPDKYKKRLRVIEKVFDYEGLSKSKLYWLAEKTGHNTCTYCNRQYTFTISGKNDSERITRPAFDHWFPKSLFPLLSLNLYNLIPSCTVCNSGAKGSTIFKLGKHIHPYMQKDDNPNFKFIPVVSSTGSWDVVLERDSKVHPEVDNTINAFALDRIYNMHGPLEVKEMMEFAQAYKGTYLQSIYNMLKKDLGSAGYNQEEVYRMLFGTESIPSKFLDRPLSKLKRDILEYLHII